MYLEIDNISWANGPGNSEDRFPKIVGDDQEFIPLPAEHNSPGTAM